MKASIAHTFVYNLIIIYILIVFGLLAATLNYYEAFKVNNMAIASIEKYEGYNDLSRAEISNILDTIGYFRSSNFNMSSCPEKKGAVVAATDDDDQIPYMLCVYEYSDDSINISSTTGKVVRKEREGSYYNYSVVSYIYVDLPLIKSFSIPVHTKAERIYKFTRTDDEGGES